MKKWLSILLCLVLTLSMTGALAAYDGSTPISEETITFTMLTTNGGGRMYDYSLMDWYQEVAKRANVNVEIELIDSSAYGDVVNTRLATGLDLPDVVRLNSTQAAYYYDSGMFMDLTEFYNNDAFYLNKVFEKNPTLKAQITSVDGKMYFLPYVLTMSGNMRCLMINASYCEALGMKVEDIKTMEDYYNYLVAVRDQDVNGNGDPSDEVPLFVMRDTGNGINQMSVFFGLDVVDSQYQMGADGKVYCSYTDEKYKEFLTWANKLYTEGLLYNEFSSAWTDTRSALYTANQVGSSFSWISNCSGYSQLISSEWNVRADEPIMVPHVIEGFDGEKRVYGRDVMGSLFAINKDCKNAEAIFRFFDYCFSDEAGMLTWCGIEGVDYNIVDGKAVQTDVYLNNENSYLVTKGYNNDMWPGFQYNYMTKECPRVQELAVELAPYVFNPTVPFSFKTVDEQEVINMYSADLGTYFEENRIAFIVGTRSLDTWDAYVSGAQGMGLDEVVEVWQGIMDRAAAAK